MELLSPLLQKLFQDWQARQHSRFPRRADFDPADFRYILGAMSLIDVHREPLRFRYRVHATEVARWSGHDLTGKFMDDIGSEYTHIVHKHFSDVVMNECPIVHWHIDELLNDKLWNLEALVLPISRDGDSLDMLLSAVAHHRYENISAALRTANPRERPRVPIPSLV